MQEYRGPVPAHNHGNRESVGTSELGCIMRKLEGEAVACGWPCSYVRDEAVRPEGKISEVTS